MGPRGHPPAGNPSSPSSSYSARPDLVHEPENPRIRALDGVAATLAAELTDGPPPVPVPVPVLVLVSHGPSASSDDQTLMPRYRRLGSSL
jgi:hypothetical protein